MVSTAGTRQHRAAPVYLKEIVVEERWNRRILPLASRVVVAWLLVLACGVGFSGCRHAASGAADVVYVTAKVAWLRDRIAPVSSKIASVSNGEKLAVLGHDRRFYQVRTPAGKTGWIEEHFVI